MMCLNSNKQKMHYAKQGQSIIIYEKDENGDIIYAGYKGSDGIFIPYLDDDGNKIPKIKKEVIGYFEPIEFFANISNKLNEVLAKDFGIDDSTNYAQITVEKGYLDLKAGDRIWKKSEIEYTEDEIIDENTSDYIVMGVADEGLSVDLYLLQRNVKQGV